MVIRLIIIGKIYLSLKAIITISVMNSFYTRKIENKEATKMGGGTPAEVTQEPTMSPEQLEMLENLIAAMAGQVQGFPMGAPYGGPGVSSYETRPFQYGGEQQKPFSAFSKDKVSLQDLIPPGVPSQTGTSPTSKIPPGGISPGPAPPTALQDVLSPKISPLSPPSIQPPTPIQSPSLQTPVQPPALAPPTGTVKPGIPQFSPDMLPPLMPPPPISIPPQTPLPMDIPPQMMNPLAPPTTGVPSPPQFDNPYGLNYDITQFKSPSPTPIPTSPTAPTSQDPIQSILTQLLTNPFVSPFKEEMTGNYPGVKPLMI